MNDSFSKNIKTRYPSHREAPNSAACTILSIGRLPSWLFSSLSSRSASRRVNRQFTTLKLSSSNQLYFSCLYHIKFGFLCLSNSVLCTERYIFIYIYKLTLQWLGHRMSSCSNLLVPPFLAMRAHHPPGDNGDDDDDDREKDDKIDHGKQLKW